MAQDNDAHRAIWSLKGASGSNPCGTCYNCLSRVTFFEDDRGWVHVYSARRHKFRKLDKDMARARFDEVTTAIGDDKKQKDQCYGIKHEPLGVQACGPSLIVRIAFITIGCIVGVRRVE